MAYAIASATADAMWCVGEYCPPEAQNWHHCDSYLERYPGTIPCTHTLYAYPVRIPCTHTLSHHVGGGVLAHGNLGEDLNR